MACRKELEPFELERDITRSGGLNEYVSRWSHLLDKPEDPLDSDEGDEGLEELAGPPDDDWDNELEGDAAPNPAKIEAGDQP